MTDDELRTSENLRKDKRDYFRSVFGKFDRDGSGTIEFGELREMLKSDDEVPRKIVKKVFKISDRDDDGRIDLDEFIAMVENEKFEGLFRGYLKNYVNFIVPRHRRRGGAPRLLKPRGRSALSTTNTTYDAEEGFSEEEGAYEQNYSCCPPPVALVVISAVEIACFLVDELSEPGSTSAGNGVTAKMFVYDPFKRNECWRFLTYMFVHIGYTHLTVNLIVQILLGVPLEMVNQWWRVLAVYFAGVVAGSLVTSITDPTCYLAGASGGVYAIITAHVSNIIMNFNEMSFPVIQLSILVILIIADVGTAIHNRYYLKIDQNIGYAAHLGGAMAGFLVGIWVLKNVEPTDKERYLWWAAFVFYVLLMATAVILNVAWTDHFP
ncbi:rhomboid-related protein 2-like isoform X3 [Cylas formicarius]|uniref:rhomboid-related protein 2-like isoform X3 n=1 Tax=Cylas formicarius TaxID=197179 RepID=UPI0029583D52|nr:rhomboid-related protein 2-like isoform X3 [Cylas formicarius]